MKAISKVNITTLLPKLPNFHAHLHSSSSSTIPNPRTLIQLLKQNPPLKLSEISSIHAQFITQNHSSNTSLLAALIRSYIASHNLNYAQILLFQNSSSSFQSPLLWNQIIQSYCKTPEFSNQSLLIFRRMLHLRRPTSCVPDNYTFTFAITASSHELSPVCGETVHGLAVKNGCQTDLFTGNALVSFYCVFKKLVDAHKMFDEMSQRDVITWTSLLRGYTMRRGQMGLAAELFRKMPERNEVSWAVVIAGYVGDARYSDALWCFHDMLNEEQMIKPNEAVLVSVLCACAHLGALDQGKWIHVYIDNRGMGKRPNICNALIDMYARCGRIDCSKEVFNGMVKRDVITWTSMIAGLSMHGQGKDALLLFHEMVEQGGIKLSGVTLLGVLNACSHSGLVEEGCTIFYSMEPLWGVKPGIEHFGCLVDLLGRAGLLEKAFQVVNSMPMKPDVVICRALLSACRIHGDVGIVEKIIHYIAQLDFRVYGEGSMLLSNLYASLGRWDCVVRVRKKMSDEKIEHDPGCSWIEVDGIVQEFLSAKALDPQIIDVHGMLNEVLI